MDHRVTFPSLVMLARNACCESVPFLRGLRRGLLSSAAAAVLLTAGAASTTPAIAADTHWTGAGGDTNWNNAANWSNGLPTGADTSRIRNGQTATVDGVSASGNRYTYIGSDNTTGHVDVLNGGNLSGGCCFYIGNYGDGSMTVSGTGSTVSAGDSVFVVGQSSGKGTLLITNGGAVPSTASYVLIGRYGGGEGIVTVTGTGSLFQSGGDLMLGGESRNSTYNTKGTLNLVEGGLVRAGSSGNRKIIIANSNGSTGTVNVGNGGTPGTVEATSMEFGNGTGVLNFNHTDTGYSFTIPITGNGEVRQLGGTTILSGSSSYSGGTTINGGTLRASSASALGTGMVTIAAGGTLDLGSNTGANAVSGSGTVTLNGNVLTLNGDGNSGVEQDATFSGTISGTGGLTINNGNDNQILTGNNTFSGGITVAGGTLTLGSNTAAGSGSITTTGSVIAYANGVNIANPIVINSDTTQLEVNGADSAEQSGVISESGGARPLEKIGTGTLTVSAANTYSGTTTVTAGTLNVTGSLASTALVVQDGAALQADGAAILDTASVTLSGTGNLSLTGNERIGSLASASNTATVALGANTLTTGDAGNTSFAGSLTGAGGLTKEGNGTFSLTGSSNYSGATTVNAGILEVTGAGALGGTGGVTIGNSGTLQVDAGALAAAQTVQVNGTGTFDVDGDTTIGFLAGVAGTIVDIANGSTLTVNQGTNGTVAGTIQGGGDLTKGGAANLILTGNNTYTGLTTVNGGVLEIKNAGVLSGNGGIVVISGEVETDGGGLGTGQSVTLNGAGLNSLLDLNGDEQISSLAGVGTVDFNSMLTINQATNTVFSGNLVGNGNLEKSGAGSLTLSGNNSFTGGIDHTGGTLVLASNNAAGTSAIFNSALLNITSNLTGGGLFTNQNGGVANFGANAITGFTGFQNDTGGIANFGNGSSFNAAANAIVNNGQLNADGMVALTGGSFSNAGGTLSMQDGATGDALTVNGAFSGSGMLETDVDYANDAADVLVINGDVTGGTTTVALNDVTIGTATGNDILLIDGNGVMPADAFQLAGPATSGAFTYDLDLVGSDWFLTLALSPSTGTFEAYSAMLSGMNGSSSLQQRMSNRNWVQGNGTQTGVSTYGYSAITAGNRDLPSGFWSRIEAAHSYHGSNGSGAGQSRDTDVGRVYFGFDSPAIDADNGFMTAGLFGFAGSASTNVSSPAGAGSIDTFMYGAGGSLTWHGDGGSYLDAAGQFIWYRSDLASGAAGSLVQNADATGYTLSLEAGKRLHVSEDWTVTPQVQVTYSNIDFDNFMSAPGSTVQLTDGDSLKGRLGVAFGREVQWQEEGMQNQRYTYVNLSLENEFLDGTEVNVAGTALRNLDDRLTGSAALGGNLTLEDGRLSLFGEVGFSTSLENLGDTGSVWGNAGFKLHY